jgi:hypothetical protein
LDAREGVDVSIDPRAVIPERCLVFELIGPVQDFNLAAQALGLEWLRTDAYDADEDADEDEESPDGEPQLLYLTMPSATALRLLLAQWRNYSAGRQAPHEYQALWKIFGYLHDLRVWSVQDRIDPAIARYVNAVLEARADGDVQVEIDLWYRTERQRRDRSVATLRAMLEQVGGRMLDLVDISEIKYQGALVTLPASVARRLAQGEGHGVALLDDVMTIRPQSAYVSPIEPDTGPAEEHRPATSTPTGDCVAALIDGYPVVNHSALAGRVRVVEVDVPAASVPVANRFHGTAMASLVLHGDMQSAGEPALGRPVVAIPVLTAVPGRAQESTPPGKLPIGVIYRALNAIVTADPLIEPDLAKVVVINHSICDEYAPFVRRPSPWALLLDYFSHEHRLLFMISAGNIFTSFPVSRFANHAAFQAAATNERQAALLLAIEEAKAMRTILSPAESVNGLTVGALHADDAPTAGGTGIDPYPTLGMTSLASAVGLGVNRSIKPDILERGGRFAAASSNVRGGGIEVHARATAHWGQQVAAPSPTGDLTRRMLTCGTSNATALATRSCHFIADALEELFRTEGTNWREKPTRAVMLKTLMAHGCSWGTIGTILERAYPPRGARDWSKRRDAVARFLGYGATERSRVVAGTSSRITLLGEDVIRHDKLHEFTLPIPASLINTPEIRAITLTLSWTCPTAHVGTDYRGVVLKLCDPAGKAEFWDGVGRLTQPNATTSARGTLVHVRLAGAKQIAAAGRLSVCVQAMAKPGYEEEDIPYALAVTIEMAQALRSELYNQVLQSVRPRVRQVN